MRGMWVVHMVQVWCLMQLTCYGVFKSLLHVVFESSSHVFESSSHVFESSSHVYSNPRHMLYYNPSVTIST